MASTRGTQVAEPIPNPPSLDDDAAFKDLTGELEVSMPDAPARVTLDITALMAGDSTNCIGIKFATEGSTFGGASLSLQASKQLVRELDVANRFAAQQTQLIGEDL